ncbi:MAG: aminoglycoside phosphotransferase family protein [Gemmatimonadaceae bacterium]
MNADVCHALEPALREALRKHLPHLLNGERLTVRYVRNRGGFVNASFHVTDDDVQLHVKVARDPESAAKLRRWRSFGSRLSERYLAPRILGAVPISDAAEATVFEFVAGQAPPEHESSWRQRVTAAISRLHADTELAAQLRTGAAQRCRDSWHQTFQERFDADLLSIGRARPPLLSPELFEALRTLAAAMGREVDAHPAFRELATAPVHGDLWRDNVLVSAGGAVTILDWDDMHVGDPALDWAVLHGFFSVPSSVSPDPGPLRLGPAARSRFELYRRATVLDGAIDSLADWIDATDAPDVMNDARDHAHRVHRAAVARLAELGLLPRTLAPFPTGHHIPR